MLPGACARHCGKDVRQCSPRTTGAPGGRAPASEFPLVARARLRNAAREALGGRSVASHVDESSDLIARNASATAQRKFPTREASFTTGGGSDGGRHLGGRASTFRTSGRPASYVGRESGLRSPHAVLAGRLGPASGCTAARRSSRPRRGLPRPNLTSMLSRRAIERARKSPACAGLCQRLRD